MEIVLDLWDRPVTSAARAFEIIGAKTAVLRLS
jgi:hypothetical protein